MNQELTTIHYFNRQTNALESEKIYGDRAIRMVYEHPMGRLLHPFVSTRWTSKFYGWSQDHSSSRKKIPQFLQTFSIPQDWYEGGSLGGAFDQSFASFNEFFIRRFRPGLRPFVSDSHLLASPCEARYFGYDRNHEDLKIPVKGHCLRPSDLAGRSLEPKFQHGPILIARLCPVDYHRFHFPDEGQVKDQWQVRGGLHSVNPLALRAKSDILITNERQVALLQTKNFGQILYIEVGATMVGKIVQTYSDKNFQRGDEKGYFLFGASTVILLGEEGAWSPSADILEYTKKSTEVWVPLGAEVGKVSRNPDP